MFRIFGAILRFMGILSAKGAGQIDNASDRLYRDPSVIRSEYDSVIQEKRSQAQEIIKALGGIQHVREMKFEEVRRLSEEIAKMEQMRKGAQVGGQQRIAALRTQNASEEQIRTDATILKFQSSFRDNSTTVTEKRQRINDIEADINTTDGNLKMYERQLQSLQREIQRLGGEKHEAVADQVLASQMKQANDLLTGLSTDKTGDRLARLREQRSRSKAEAKQSAKLAGMDNANVEAELLELAGNTAADDEFASLIGLASPTISIEQPVAGALPSGGQYGQSTESRVTEAFKIRRS